MNATIRQEVPADFKAVETVIAAAFKEVKESDQTEHSLVKRLRNSEAFVPELSLVALLNEQIVGHILLTKIEIRDAVFTYASLALAPVSVHPDFQNKGIGGQLILEAHQVAKRLGYSSIVLVGHANYYPRFGYELCSKYGIQFPFPVPEANGMVVELKENGLQNVNGTIQYAKEFFG